MATKKQTHWVRDTAKLKHALGGIVGFAKRPVVLSAAVAIVFLSLLFMMLSRAPSVNNVNTCISNCTFNN